MLSKQDRATRVHCQAQAAMYRRAAVGCTSQFSQLAKQAFMVEATTWLRRSALVATK